MILQASDPFGGVYYSSPSRSTPTLVYCFGDSQVLALAIKHAAQGAKTPTAKVTAESIAEEALTSDKPEVLWNARAKLQITSSAVASVRSLALPTSPVPVAAELNKSPREQLLERLYEVGDREAGQMLLQTKYAARAPLLAKAQTATAQEGKPKALTTEELVAIEKLLENSKANSNSATLSTPLLLWLSDEYRLAKQETKAETIYAEAVKLAESNSGTYYNSFLTRDRELALKLFAKSLERQLQTQRGAASSNS